MINADLFLSPLLQNLFFKCFSTKLYTMLDYISIRHQIEIFCFCNLWQIFARSVVKTFFVGLWFATYFISERATKLANLMLATSFSSWVHHLIEELYEHPGLFIPQVKQHFCIALCRLIACICC